MKKILSLLVSALAVVAVVALVFTPLGCPTPAVPMGPLGVVVSGTTQTTTTITWHTDVEASSQVEYGETAECLSATTLDETLVTSHSVTVTGLSAGTTYHFRVKSVDAEENLIASDVYTFAALPLGTLKLGITVPFTGSQAGKFHDLLYTMQWLAEDINSGDHWLAEPGGGIKVGDTVYNVSIIAEDGTSDNMYAGISKLYYEDGVIMILGQCGSAGVVSIHTILEGEGLLYVGAAATSRDTMYFRGEPVQFFCRTQSLAGDKVASVYTQMFKPETGFYAIGSDNDCDKNADGVISIYQILPDSIDGEDIADCADAFIEAHGAEYNLKLAGRDFCKTPVSGTTYATIIAKVLASDADVIDTGSTLEADQATLLKELYAAGWDGLTFQPVGGGTWSQLLDLIGPPDNMAALEGLVQDYRPPSEELFDPDYVAWMEAQELEQPAWVGPLWDKAGDDPKILRPTAVIQFYSEGSNMLEAMQTAGSTEQTRENALAIRDALVEIPVVSYFGDLNWGGEITYDRKCALDYLVHRGYFKDDGTMEWLGPLLLTAP